RACPYRGENHGPARMRESLTTTPGIRERPRPTSEIGRPMPQPPAAPGWIHEIKHPGAGRCEGAVVYPRPGCGPRRGVTGPAFVLIRGDFRATFFHLDVPTIFSGDTVKVFRSFRPDS